MSRPRRCTRSLALSVATKYYRALLGNIFNSNEKIFYPSPCTQVTPLPTTQHTILTKKKPTTLHQIKSFEYKSSELNCTQKHSHPYWLLDRMFILKRVVLYDGEHYYWHFSIQKHSTLPNVVTTLSPSCHHKGTKFNFAQRKVSAQRPPGDDA